MNFVRIKNNPTHNSSGVGGNLRSNGFPTIENKNVTKIPYTQRQQREARSIHTSRHHQKSQVSRQTPSRQNLSKVSRSQRSEIQPRSRVTNSHSKKSSKKSSQKLSQQEMVKESPNVRVSEKSESSYKRISDTDVSDVNNLVCDICVNKDAFNKKMQDLEAQREEDVAFAQNINQQLQDQLADERAKNAEKKRIYKEALFNQRQDMEEKKARENAEDKAEDERIRDILANNDDLLDRAALEEAKRQKFINGLMGQMNDNERKRAEDMMNELELDKMNPNLLIDDGWRAEKREAIKEYYKNNLINQIREKDNKNKEDLSRQGHEDAYYRDALSDLIKNEEDRKKQLAEEKKAILMNELENQLQEKQRAQQLKDQLAQMEDDHVMQKLDNDNKVYMINMEKKKNAMKYYIDDIHNQMDNDRAKKCDEIEELKKKTQTTLDMGKKPHKCYNCAKCRQVYPLKQLNKKKRRRK